MALSSHLQQKSRLHLQRAGVMRWRRFTSSSTGETETTSSQPKKKASLSKEQTAVAVESFVKENVETHSGTLPKTTHVHNKVGGSWNKLIYVLTNLRDKILGNPPLENHSGNATSDSRFDATASGNISTDNISDTSEHGEATVMSSQFDKGCTSSTATACALGKNSSKNMINATASVIVQTGSNVDNTELNGREGIFRSSKSLVDSYNDEKTTISATSLISEERSSADSICTGQLLEPQVVSHVDERGISTSGPSHIVSKNSCMDTVPSINTSDSLKLVESESERMKPDRPVSDIFSDQLQKVKSMESPRFHMQTKASRTLQAPLSELFSSGHQNNKPKLDMKIINLAPNAGPDMRITPPVFFGGAQRSMGLADIFARSMNYKEAGEMIGEKNDNVTPNSPKYSIETTGSDIIKGYGVKGLIDCIKDLPRGGSIIRSHDNIMSGETDRTSNKVATGRTKPVDNLQSSDNKGRKTSLDGHDKNMEGNNLKGSEGDQGWGNISSVLDKNSKIEAKEKSDADIAALNCNKSKPSPQVSQPLSKVSLNSTRDALLVEKGSDENKVLVRFLFKDTKKGQIDSIFKDCGCISKIEFHDKGRSPFKLASVYFETKEGMQKALEKSGREMIYNATVIVEAACSSENRPNKTLFPGLIGYPDVPTSLVKNPTRTVMIKQLTPGISPNDIEEALAFCGSNISGFFFGPSHSVAYVEFETEAAKERALEKHSINVCGKQQLLIFRIDSPRTTVVRLSTPHHQGLVKKPGSISMRYGQVKLVVKRHKGIVDVHFKITEWPNMLKILNGLNGLQLDDGTRLIARPAPVFPPEVLQVLWSHPDGRRHLRNEIRNLLQNLDEPLAHKAGVTDMMNKYYRMD